MGKGYIGTIDRSYGDRMGLIIKVFVILLFSGSDLLAGEPGKLAQHSNLDYVWVLISAILVFIMQAGFLCVEAGMARAKNSINVAIKNLCDFVIASCSFWFIGFAVMFGENITDYGIVGWTSSLSALDVNMTLMQQSLIGHPVEWVCAFFIFQVVFTGTAATIDSGALAGRTRFSSYLMLSAFLSVIIYPIFGHWAWGSLLMGESSMGWLEKMGFLDFAGSTVVHSVGGWAALAGVIVVGPRIGKYNKDGSANTISPHNMPMVYLGVFILFFGWFGFNCGSTTEATPEIAKIAMTTVLAACFACLTSTALSWFFSSNKRPEGDMIANGILGGLVGITAGCNMVSGVGAMIIGVVSGGLVYGGTKYLEKVLKIDDVVGAIAVHGICGAWGTIGLAIVPGVLPEGATVLSQLGVQFTGVAICFVWTFGLTYIFLKVLNSVGLNIRVEPEAEILGLNISEHGASSTILELANAMHGATTNKTFDDSVKVDVEVGTEIGDLGHHFNLMIDAIQMEQFRAFKSQKKVEEMGAREKERLKNYSSYMEENVATIRAETHEIESALKRTYEKSNNMIESVAIMNGVIQTSLNSLKGIVVSAGEAKDISSEAKNETISSKDVVDSLGDQANNITTIVKTITEISDQTKLLALNANIESCRAGEFGKAFSVVANEVKELSDRSNHSARMISDKISNIQSSSDQTIDTINGITGIIERIHDINNNIAQAIAEQSNEGDKMISTANIAGENAKDVGDIVKDVARRSEAIRSKIDDLYLNSNAMLEA